MLAMKQTMAKGVPWVAILLSLAVLYGCNRDRPTPMISVPEGPFHMGCNPETSPRCDDDERPGRLFRLDAFEMDAHEVTVAQYEQCVKKGACTPPATVETHPGCNWGSGRSKKNPVNCVSWSQARQYCAWRGKRLPSEAEWEKAARGTDGRNYPWGNRPEPSCERAVVYEGGPGCGGKATLPVGGKPLGRSPHGMDDMLGNVYEWVQDGYDSHMLDHATERNPRGPVEGKGPVMKGGAYTETYFRLSDRTGAKSRDKQDPTVGFRCARSQGDQ
jgi:formylglycine-generating enzyme required for sulfatase activity